MARGTDLPPDLIPIVASRPLCAEQLAARIRREGPIPVAEYMAVAAEAYYARGEVFGRAGDFITAPEISQIFGELAGLWCAVAWEGLGKPIKFNLVECGPGRGTLMRDALRAAGNIPGLQKAARIHLVERSAALMEQQRAVLHGSDVHWCANLEQVPDGPLVLVANEFLDALPVRQFVKGSAAWQERCVTLDDRGSFIFTTREVSDPPPVSGPPGAICETSPAIKSFVGSLGARLKHCGGAALLIDYGYSGPAIGDTLQAVKNHARHPVLSEPGEADVTAHVDFSAVAAAAAAEGIEVYGPIAQGAWLERLGIHVRGERLKAGKSREMMERIESGVRRLIRPDAMGTLFKAIALTSPGFGVPAGFDP